MIKVTEHFPGVLPAEVKPIWIDAYVFTENNQIIDEDTREDVELIEEQIRDLAVPYKSLSRFSRNSPSGFGFDPGLRKQHRITESIHSTLIKLKEKASQARSKGNWREYIEMMERYVDVKASVYDFNHPDVLTAVVSYILVLINYSTILAEKANFSASFEILCTAEDRAKNVKDPKMKSVLSALVFNSCSNYFHKKKKYNGCTKYCKEALKNWKKLSSVDYMFYFLLKYATALGSSGKYEDSYERLQTIMQFLNQEDLQNRGNSLPFQISFKIPSLENQEIFFDEAVYLVTLHNLAVAQCATRKYGYAVSATERCLNVMSKLNFDRSHPWFKQVLKTFDFAQKQNTSMSFEHFRMKSSETHHQEILQVSKKIENFVRQSKYGGTSSKKKSRSSDSKPSLSLSRSLSPRKKKLLSIMPFLEEDIEEIILKDDNLIPDPVEPQNTSIIKKTDDLPPKRSRSHNSYAQKDRSFILKKQKPNAFKKKKPSSAKPTTKVRIKDDTFEIKSSLPSEREINTAITGITDDLGEMLDKTSFKPLSTQRTSKHFQIQSDDDDDEEDEKKEENSSSTSLSDTQTSTIPAIRNINSERADFNEKTNDNSTTERIENEESEFLEKEDDHTVSEKIEQTTSKDCEFSPRDKEEMKTCEREEKIERNIDSVEYDRDVGKNNMDPTKTPKEFDNTQGIFDSNDYLTEGEGLAEESYLHDIKEEEIEDDPIKKEINEIGELSGESETIHDDVPRDSEQYSEEDTRFEENSDISEEKPKNHSDKEVESFEDIIEENNDEKLESKSQKDEIYLESNVKNPSERDVSDFEGMEEDIIHETDIKNDHLEIEAKGNAELTGESETIHEDVPPGPEQYSEEGTHFEENSDMSEEKPKNHSDKGIEFVEDIIEDNNDEKLESESQKDEIFLESNVKKTIQDEDIVEEADEGFGNYNDNNTGEDPSMELKIQKETDFAEIRDSGLNKVGEENAEIVSDEKEKDLEEKEGSNEHRDCYNNLHDDLINRDDVPSDNDHDVEFHVHEENKEELVQDLEEDFEELEDDTNNSQLEDNFQSNDIVTGREVPNEDVATFEEDFPKEMEEEFGDEIRNNIEQNTGDGEKEKFLESNNDDEDDIDKDIEFDVNTSNEGMALEDMHGDIGDEFGGLNDEVGKNFEDFGDFETNNEHTRKIEENENLDQLDYINEDEVGAEKLDEDEMFSNFEM